MRQQTELLDQFTNKAEEPVVVPTSQAALDTIPESELIGIRSSSFTWSPENDGTATPGSSRRNFTLTIEDEVFFKQGSINLIVGQTGSGKTSLLMALLGMTLLDTSVLLIDKSGLKVKCIILQLDRTRW